MMHYLLRATPWPGKLDSVVKAQRGKDMVLDERVAAGAAVFHPAV